ncbi:MAG: hypothetical protein IKO11_09690, partial [Lachnospiraceae bacterium]|nr:hypothetical protein [Lachnospiraceae bacterium]
MWKKIKKFWKLLILMIALMISKTTFLCGEIAVNAEDTTINVSGKQYEMEEDSKYIYSVDSKDSNILASGSQFGKFTINGSVENISSVNGFTAFKVKGGVVQFSYVPDGKVINAMSTDLHLYEDTTKEVNGISLDGKVGKGALILQTSIDSIHWITDIIKTDIATDETDYSSDFFESQEIQQINGCYYRVLVAYKTEKKVGETSVIAGLGKKDVNEYKEFAEVYEFYLRDTSEETLKNGAHPNKRQVIGDMSNVVNTGKDNGFSGKDDILADDPHYGW